MSKLTWLIIVSVMMFLFGCTSSLPTQSDPLIDMEVSRAIFEMPQDEGLRKELPLGVFTGVEAGDSRLTLEEQLKAPEGLLVTKIVENSPAVAAGIQTGDIILEAAIDENEPILLQWPSDWFKLEQMAKVDSDIHVLYDRAGRDFRATIKPEKRINPPNRLIGDTFREESRVGIIVRNASEVEAEKAGLIRGEGCVVIGLARTSPWRKAGMLFGDVILKINDKAIKNPQELLMTINALKKNDDVKMIVFRDGKKVELNTTVSRRQKEVKKIDIPLLFSYNKKRGIEETSMLLGLFNIRKTKVASELKLFWFINFTIGDSSRLEEVK